MAHWVYQRDVPGRITQKTETVQGATATFDYAYDPAGRLIEVKRDGVVQASYDNRVTINGQLIASYDAWDRRSPKNKSVPFFAGTRWPRSLSD